MCSRKDRKVNSLWNTHFAVLRIAQSWSSSFHETCILYFFFFFVRFCGSCLLAFCCGLLWMLYFEHSFCCDILQILDLKFVLLEILEILDVADLGS